MRMDSRRSAQILRNRWWRVLTLAGILAMSPPAEAQEVDEFPALRPIRTEIPTTFWERQGRALTLYSLELLALGAFGVWLFSRPRARVTEPLAVVTQRRLEQLRTQPRNRDTASAIVRCVRGYYRAAFGLAAGEPTTEAFCRELIINPSVGSALADRVVRFVRGCDATRFAAAGYANVPELLQQANELFEAGEARRRELQALPSGQLAFRIS